MTAVTRTADAGGLFHRPARWADMADWHEQVAELRRSEPVLVVEDDEFSPFWVLTRHEDVFAVSRDDAHWKSTARVVLSPDAAQEEMLASPFVPRSLVQLDDHEHTAHRKVTNDWFKPAAVSRLQPAIDAIADEYADRLVELGGSCDLAQDLAVPFTLRVIMTIFGVPEQDEALMLRLTQGIFGAADPEYLGDFTDPLAFLSDTLGTFTEYFGELTADRRAHPADDLATVLANGQVDGGPLGETELLWYYIIVATAGHDTTSFAFGGGMEQLLRNPDQLRALQADPSLAQNAAEEMIRWTSPVRSFFRWTQEDTEVGGQAIAKGDVVLTSYPSANRDETVFVDPMRFDITRPDADKTLAFGLGMHYCLGAQVARREVRTLLSKVLERIDTMELAGEPEYQRAHFVSGVKHLPVTYTLR